MAKHYQQPGGYFNLIKDIPTPKTRNTGQGISASARAQEAQKQQQEEQRRTGRGLSYSAWVRLGMEQQQEEQQRTGQGLSYSAWVRQGMEQQRQAEIDADREFDIWQDNMPNERSTGFDIGGSPSVLTSDLQGGGDDRITREEALASQVDCDDDKQEEVQEAMDKSLTALPVSVFAPTEQSEEFLFDQYSEMGHTGEFFSPGMLDMRQGWYQHVVSINGERIVRNYPKHSRMIPLQYYYDSLITTPYIMRDHLEQKDPRVNLGSNATTNPNLFDNLRYVLGCTWEANSLQTGTPKTALMIASNFEKFDTNAVDFADSMARRGIFFCLRPSVNMEINPSFNNFSGLDLSPLKTLNLSNPQFGYETFFGLLTTMSILKKMEIANPSIDWDNFNVFTYLKDLAQQRELVINTSANNSSKKMVDHSFRAPTGFPVSELDLSVFNPLRYKHEFINSNLVKITSHNRARTEQFYTNTYPHERYKKSIYRAFNYTFPSDDKFRGSNFGTPTATPSDPNQEASQTDIIDNIESFEELGISRPLRDDIIQKFPASQVERIREINDSILIGNPELQTTFSEYVAGQDVTVPFEYWVNSNLTNYNLIQFKMGHPSSFATLLQYHGLDTLFMEMLDLTKPANRSYYAQILDTVINKDRDLRSQEELDRASINLTPNEVRDPLRLMKAMTEAARGNTSEGDWHGEFAYEDIDAYSYPLAYDGITRNTRTGGQADIFNLIHDQMQAARRAPESSDERIDLTSLAPDLDPGRPFELHFRSIYMNYNASAESQMHRRASQIIGGAPCYSEVVAYRLVKIDASTRETVQEFYFFNSFAVEDFKFVDSQVLPGKRYIYKIFTINFVIGSEYRYDFDRSRIASRNVQVNFDFSDNFDDNNSFNQLSAKLISPKSVTEAEYPDPAFANLLIGGGTFDKKLNLNDTLQIITPLIVTPSYRIIEAPYYEQIVVATTNDLPPIYPDVQVVDSYRSSKQNLSAVMIYPFARFGTETAEPIALEGSDSEMLATMREVQQVISQSEDLPSSINYRSDSEPERYEMFYTFFEPIGYSSFSATGNKVSTTREKRFFDLNLPFNTKIYVTFRSIDLAGFSNPSPIFELTRHNYGDGTYTTFEPYEPRKRRPHITCSRLISIEAATQQKIFNIEDDSGEVDFTSAPEDLQSITLGKPIDNEELLWGRKFKFRFTSASSYNSFDVNCDFTFNKKQIGESQPPRTNAPNAQSNHPQDTSRRNRRGNNANISQRGRNNPGIMDNVMDQTTLPTPAPNDISFGMFDQPATDATDLTVPDLEPELTMDDRLPFNNFFDPYADAPTEVNEQGVMVSKTYIPDYIGPEPSSTGGSGATTLSSTGGGGGATISQSEEERRRRQRRRAYAESQY